MSTAAGKLMLTSAGPSAFAPSLAPSGFHWEFVTSGGVLVTLANQPVVSLRAN